MDIFETGFEPNNTIPNAPIFTISSGETVNLSGILGLGVGDTRDVDLIGFEVSKPVSLLFDFINLDTFNNSGFTLRLFDTSGNQLNLDQNGPSIDPFFFPIFEQGIYYLGISSEVNTNYNPRVASSGESGPSYSYAGVLNFNSVNSTETNTPPVINGSLSDISITATEIATFQFPDNTFSDPDGDNLSFQAFKQQEQPLPDWLTFDPDTRTFTATPDSSDVGSVNIDVVAIDPFGEFVVDTFTISVESPEEPPLEVSIVNPDPIPEQGSGENSNLRFTVTLNQAPSEQVTVDFATAEGTATAGEDYQSTSGTLSFEQGETEQTVEVPVFGDNNSESDETFSVELSNPSEGLTLSDAVASGTILNDDSDSPNAESIARVFLKPNVSYAVANSNSTFFGSAGGASTLLIEPGVIGIDTNAQIGRIDLPFNLDEVSFQVTDQGLEVNDRTNSITTIPSLNQELDLRLSNGNVTVSQTGAQQFTLINPNNSNEMLTVGTSQLTSPSIGLGNQTSIIDGGHNSNPANAESIALVFLKPNVSYAVANSNSTFFGSATGASTLLIEPGVTGIDTNAQIGSIDLPLSLDELTLQVTDKGLEFSNENNTIITLPSLNQELDLRLDDGNVITTQTGAQEFTLTNPNNNNDTITISNAPITAPSVGLGNQISETAEGMVNNGSIPVDSAEDDGQVFSFAGASTNFHLVENGSLLEEVNNESQSLFNFYTLSEKQEIASANNAISFSETSFNQIEDANSMLEVPKNNLEELDSEVVSGL